MSTKWALVPGEVRGPVGITRILYVLQEAVALERITTHELLHEMFLVVRLVYGCSEVRKEFYKSASSQLSLLKSIGVSQMERELEDEVKSMEERISRSKTTADIPQLEEHEAKEILHDVLNELYYSKAKKR